MFEKILILIGAALLASLFFTFITIAKSELKLWNKIYMLVWIAVVFVLFLLGWDTMLANINYLSTIL